MDIRAAEISDIIRKQIENYDKKVEVTFHGERVSGRYHLFHIGRDPKDWMIRRVDPPADDAAGVAAFRALYTDPVDVNGSAFTAAEDTAVAASPRASMARS